MTVHGVEDPWVADDELETPLDDANRFVAVEATIESTGDDPQGFSSLLQAELIDSEDRTWDAAHAGFELPQLDAVTVGPDEVRRGWVVFEVPPDAEDFRVRIKGELTANGSVFDLDPATDP